MVGEKNEREDDAGGNVGSRERGGRWAVALQAEEVRESKSPKGIAG